MAAVLITGPAATAIAYGFPSGVGNNGGNQIDEDGHKVKETKDKVKDKVAEAKSKWEKKHKDDGGGDDGRSENNDSGDSGSGGSSEGSGSDSGDSSSDEGPGDSGSSDESSGDGSDSDDESSGESQDDSSNSEGDAGDDSGEENSEESGEEEVVEETVEEPVEEETVEEVVEEPEEYPEGTFPDSYFIDKPMEKFQLQKYHITDLDGNRLMSIKEGEDVEIDYSLRNIQQKEQTYVMIAQIVDQQGVTIDMGWFVDTIQSGEYADWYGSWTPDSSGLCTIKIMVWEGIDENPVPITKITEMTILVHPA